MSFSNALVSAIADGCNVSAKEAKALAAKIIAAGAKNGVSGDVHYWPQRLGCLDTAERDAAIRDRFNGRNLSEVCAAFDVSAATVYRAINKA